MMALDREQIANWDEAPACWQVKPDRLVVREAGKEVSVPFSAFGDLVLDMLRAMQGRN